MDAADDNDVVLQRVGAHDAATLANLLELYIHDLSETFELEVGDDGRFGYAPLARYFAEADQRFAFFIRVHAKLAGFALVTRGSPLSDDPSVLDVAEFFVLRAHRRAGVGRHAARLLWDALPGSWVVRVAATNRAGLSFWRAAIADYTGAAVERAVSRPDRDWHVLEFASPA
jgi:predicted acetyltransferase